MTEEQWRSSRSSYPMLWLLVGQPRPSGRKLRLAACAFCRRHEQALSGPACREALEAAERFADGSATARELRDRLHVARMASREQRSAADDPARLLLSAISDAALADAVEAALTVHTDLERYHCQRGDDLGAEYAAQAAVLRDIFGNPIRPAAVEPAWLTSTVVGLARGIYEERAFDRMGLLHDALLDAGCDSAEVLSHCRSDGPHTRGCWLIDRLLGRE